MRVRIVLKSGASVAFDVEEFTTTRSYVHSGLEKLKWTTPSNWKDKLHFVNIEDIVAILVMRDPEEGEESE